MKIVFLTRRFWPEIGGVEKHCLEIGKRLVEKGHDVTVVSETASSNGKHSISVSAKDTGEIYGIRIKRINSGKDGWFKKFRIWKELWGQRELLKKADIIHCHDVFFWYFPFRFLYPRKPVFVTFHGYEGNKIPGKKAIFSHKIAEKLTNGNICIGDFLKKWYGTKPTIVSYGASDITSSIISKSKDKQILFLGRLEDETGIMEYLMALKIIGRKFKYQLRILGDGSLRKKAEDFCRLNKINTRFYGFIDNVAQYLKGSDIVFVSRYLGIVEALAAKKLVFSVFNNDIKKDYLEITPFKDFIYIDQDSKGIADNLLKKTDLKKAEKGYEWAKKQTWEKLANQYLKLWGV